MVTMDELFWAFILSEDLPGKSCPSAGEATLNNVGEFIAQKAFRQ